MAQGLSASGGRGSSGGDTLADHLRQPAVLNMNFIVATC